MAELVESLPTNYEDAEWEGMKKFELINNSDSTVSLRDVTNYTKKENSFFGAKQANQIGEAYNSIINKLNAKIEKYTMLASGWNNRIYSFESTYPQAEYDVEIELDGDSATADQADAWGSAKLAGSSTANRVKALGDVPTVAIPVILKVVQK